MTKVSISVIIPAKDALATLDACLRAVIQQEQLIFNQDYEVILVDDGSTDSTALLAAQYGVRVIRQANAGPASARNTGAQAAFGEILVFTDADCSPASDWLRQLVDPFKDLRVAGVKGVYRTQQSGAVARFVQLEYQYKYLRLARLATIDFVDTYAAAYRKEVFLANGGFDPSFKVPSVEDQEFSFRLAAKGYRLVFAANAAVYHQHDKDLNEYFRRKWGIGYWKAYMLRWMPQKILGDSHTLPSQNWQLLFFALLCLSLPWIFIQPVFGWIHLAAWAGFIATVFPFIRYLLQSDPRLLGIGMGLLIARTLALGLGLLAGILFPAANRSRKSL